MTLTKGNAILKIGDGTMSEAFTEIAPLTSLAWDGLQYDNEEITPIGTSDRARHYVTTLYSGGNVTFTMTPYASDNTNQALVYAKNLSGEVWNFELVNPAGDHFFSGMVQSCKPITNVDGVFGMDVTVMVTGPVVLD